MIKSWFKPKFQVVEVEVPRKLAELTSEMKESLHTLSGHPGFVYLLGKLKFERSLLQTQLKTSRHESLRDVEFLQSGILWSEWLERTLNKLVYRNAPKVAQASSEEARALEEFMRSAESLQILE